MAMKKAAPKKKAALNTMGSDRGAATKSKEAEKKTAVRNAVRIGYAELKNEYAKISKNEAKGRNVRSAEKARKAKQTGR